MARGNNDSLSQSYNYRHSHSKRMMFLNSMRSSAASPPPSPRQSQQQPSSYDPDLADGDAGIDDVGGPPLIDRLAFVLVGSCNSGDHKQVWWPAWIFESATEMFHELSLTPQHRAALMQEFFEVGRQQQPTKAQQHVAYLLGGTIPGSRRTVYGSQTRDFWTISDEVVSKCSEYPGWCDACLAAPELSNCNLEGVTTTSLTTTIPHRTTSTSPLRGSRSYVSPSTSPVRNGRSYEYDDDIPSSTSTTVRGSSTAATTASAVKYRRRRHFN